MKQIQCECGKTIYVETEKSPLCPTCDGSAPARLDNATRLIERVLEGSIPYVSKYGAFMIRQEDWAALAEFMNPQIKKLGDLLRKREQGDKLTPEEIKDALGSE